MTKTLDEFTLSELMAAVCTLMAAEELCNGMVKLQRLRGIPLEDRQVVESTGELLRDLRASFNKTINSKLR